MKKYKFLSLFLITILMSLVLSTVAGADVSDDLKDANALQNELQAELAENQQKVNSLKEKQGNLESEIAEVDAQIEDISKTLEDYAAKLEEKQARVNELVTQMEDLNVRIDDAYKRMSLRIKYIYESGSTSFLDAILSASSIEDVINNIAYTEEITRYDQRMQEELMGMLNQLNANKKEADQALADIQALYDAQEQERKVLEDLQSIKYGELAVTEEELNKEMAAMESLNAELEANADKISELSSQLDNMDWLDDDDYNDDDDDGGGGYAPQISGSWIWPLDNYFYVSSGFGARWGSFHAGIDIPAPEGTPVKAVDGGIVVLARWSPTYDTGNYIVIYHGNGVYSEYMHLSDIWVYDGQYVSQGQYIGAVGNTGESYGAHLHLSKGIGDCYWQNRVDPFG
ncbi:MAG: peptidoglycan DD-metalloendopeptidase family protein [Lachnospiraceae bacterium]|nr:peptidoglycan DD-metalloendopeptidase family protein [Lachnospiraceae bacterium]